MTKNIFNEETLDLTKTEDEPLFNDVDAINIEEDFNDVDAINIEEDLSLLIDDAIQEQLNNIMKNPKIYLV